MNKLLLVFLVLPLFVVPGAADHNEDLLPDGIQNSIDYRGQTGNPDVIKNSRDIPAMKMGGYRAASGDRCIITVQEVDNVQQDLGVLTVEKGTGMVGPKDFPSYRVKKAGKAGFGDYDGGAPKLYGPLSDNPENIEIQGDIQVDFPVVCQDNSGGHAVWKQDENIETENGGGLDSGNNWYCYLDNTDGDRLVPKTCTGSSDEISTQGADLLVSSWGETYTRGLCGYGGMTKDFDQNPGMIELYVKAETLAWGQAGVYVEDSDGDIHTIKEWSGGGSTTSSDWTLVEENLVGYGNNIKLIVGNDDNSENCGNNDHEFRIWASEDNPVEDSSTSTNEEERDTSNEETTENEENNNNNEEEQQEETQQTSGNEESQPVCNGEFDAWLAESTVADYPIEIRGCTTDDLEQINVMMGYDDGVTSYSTLSIKPSGVNCNGGTCELTNVKYNEHDDKDYGFTMEITDGKNFADLNKPVKVDTDVIALKERYPGGRAGPTDSNWLEEACGGSTYSCVDSEQPYKADLVATVGLKTDYSPNSSVVLKEGQTVRFPEGCEYQATYVYQNQPKLKIWHSGTSTGETSIGDTENFETQEGTEIEINSWNPDEVSLSATCSEWDTENENNNSSTNSTSSQEIDTDITWINYCQNQDSGDLTQTENIVSCLTSCYGESKDSSAEGSDDLTCGEVVKSYCDSANAEYDEEGDTARCS